MGIYFNGTYLSKKEAQKALELQAEIIGMQAERIKALDNNLAACADALRLSRMSNAELKTVINAIVERHCQDVPVFEMFGLKLPVTFMNGLQGYEQTREDD